MKPDWKDAPDWAMWLAQDDDGEWGWFANEPILHDGKFGAFWFDPQYGQCETESRGRPGLGVRKPVKEPRP